MLTIIEVHVIQVNSAVVNRITVSTIQYLHTVQKSELGINSLSLVEYPGIRKCTSIRLGGHKVILLCTFYSIMFLRRIPASKLHDVFGYTHAESCTVACLTYCYSMSKLNPADMVSQVIFMYNRHQLQIVLYQTEIRSAILDGHNEVLISSP